MWRDFRQDLMYAGRSLRHAPAFTAIALLTLALGIGANTAIFSVIHGVLLRPLPYRHTDRLVVLWSSSSRSERDPLSPGRFVDFRERLTSLSAAAGICQFGVVLTDSGIPEQIDASSVSSTFFDVLGAPALLGDPFHAGSTDDRAVVISYGLWTRRFGSDRSIVGRAVTINGASRRIVAVMPKDFDWPPITAQPSNGSGPELWIPGAVRDIPRTPVDSPAEDLSANRRLGILRMVARLKEGVTIGQAQREADLVAERLGSEYPGTDRERGATLVPLRTQFFGPVTRPLLVLLGAVGFVLAIACANVASLLLGRAASRRREIAIRLALGAARVRVLRQLLTESLVLSMAGAVAGVLLAWWGQRWLVALDPGGVPRLGETGIDGMVLAFALAIALVTGLAFGAAPAWQISAVDPSEDLRDGGTRGASDARGGRTRDALVAMEVAVAVLLLVGAGLLVRSFTALSSVRTGIETAHLLTFGIGAPGGRSSSPPRQVAFYNDVLGRIRALPGVTAAGAAVTLPIGGDTFSITYTVDGQPLPPSGEEPGAGWQIVTPGYFTALGMRILDGRDFADGDRADALPVIAVNETLARQIWPGANPLGRRLRLGREAADPVATVIALVSDIRHGGPASPPRPEIYQPLTQRAFGSMSFVVRTAGDPLALAPVVRAAAATVDASVPLSRVASMDQHVERSLSRPRFMSTLIAAFGALALALAVVGLYGVMSFAVAARTREIAIRMALGARPRDVLTMVLGKAIGLTLCGIVAGLIGAGLLTRLLTGLLFEIGPADPVTFILTPALMLAVGLLAGAVPAVRATRIHSATTLRG